MSVPPTPVRTILVTGVGGPAGRSLCRQLRRLRKGLRLIAVATRDVSHCADVLITGPSADSPDFVPFLRNLVTEYEVDLLIPTVREELPVIAENASRLDTRVLLSGPEALHEAAARLEDAPTPTEGLTYCPQVYRSPVDDSLTTVLLQQVAPTGLTDPHPGAVIRVGRSIAPDVTDLAEATVRSLDLTGPIHLGIRRDGQGGLRVVRVHASFGAYSALAPELLTGLLADAAQLSPVPAVTPVG